jgi:hypothetical protein
MSSESKPFRARATRLDFDCLMGKPPPAREMVARTGIEPATQGFSVFKNPIWQLL